VRWGGTLLASITVAASNLVAAHADAPAFEKIVRREGRDEAYFARFMQEDHFPMTTFRLFDHEKADVVAYLLALQRQGAFQP